MLRFPVLCCLPSVKKQKHFYFVQFIVKHFFRFGLSDIKNNQGLCKGYQSRSSASADN